MNKIFYFHRRHGWHDFRKTPSFKVVALVKSQELQRIPDRTTSPVLCGRFQRVDRSTGLETMRQHQLFFASEPYIPLLEGRIDGWNFAQITLVSSLNKRMSAKREIRKYCSLIFLALAHQNSSRRHVKFQNEGRARAVE